MTSSFNLRTATDIVVCGFVIPILVSSLASAAVDFICKYYLKINYLQGHIGFKLSMWIAIIWIWLTIFYYIFCLFYFVFKRTKWRYVFFIPFICLPAMLFACITPYDWRISLCFALFNIAYYALFFIEQSIPDLFYRMTKKRLPYEEHIQANK